MCAKITMCDGGELPWVDEIRYLGVVIIRGAKFKCSIDKAKRSYREANGIFAKIGRLASEEVMVQLLKQKCLPILLYALDVCNLDKKQCNHWTSHLIDFFMKLFKTSTMEIVNCCQSLLGCDLPSTLLKQCFEKFITSL